MKGYSLRVGCRDKHSSLLGKSVNYGRHKFFDTGPCFISFQIFTQKTTKQRCLFASKLFTSRQNIPLQKVFKKLL
jgi:hypothetical protein